MVSLSQRYGVLGIVFVTAQSWFGLELSRRSYGWFIGELTEGVLNKNTIAEWRRQPGPRRRACDRAMEREAPDDSIARRMEEIMLKHESGGQQHRGPASAKARV